MRRSEVYGKLPRPSVRAEPSPDGQNTFTGTLIIRRYTSLVLSE